MSNLKDILSIGSKLEFLNKQFEIPTINECDSNVLFCMFKKTYMTIDEIVLKSKQLKTNVVGSLEKLVDLGFVFVSSNKFIVSETGDNLIEISAKEWFEYNFPDAKLSTGGKSKRPITEMMDVYKDIVYGIFGDAARPHIISRQNYKIKFVNMKSGFKLVELRNDGKLRIVVSKSRNDLIAEFSAYDGVRIIEPSAQSYVYKFDIDCDEEILKSVCESIKPRLI